MGISPTAAWSLCASSSHTLPPSPCFSFWLLLHFSHAFPQRWAVAHSRAGPFPTSLCYRHPHLQWSLNLSWVISWWEALCPKVSHKLAASSPVFHNPALKVGIQKLHLVWVHEPEFEEALHCQLGPSFFDLGSSAGKILLGRLNPSLQQLPGLTSSLWLALIPCAVMVVQFSGRHSLRDVGCFPDGHILLHSRRT